MMPRAWIGLGVAGWMVLAAPAGAATLEEIYALANRREYQQALPLLETYLQQHPGDVRAGFLHGLILTDENRQEEAIQVFRRLTEQFPNLPEPHNNLAVLYAERGEFALAAQSLRNAIRTHPTYAVAHENLGDIYARMASDAYSKALQLGGENAATQAKLVLVKKIIAAPPAQAGAPAAPQQAAAPTPDQQAMRQLQGELMKTVQQWAKAWSNQDVDAYLASYSETFQPDGNLTRGQWAKIRAQRLTAPRFIRVRLGNLEVRLVEPGKAHATFVQQYRSENYADQVLKILILEREGETWKITREMTDG